MRRTMSRFHIYRDADGWYVSREGWPIDVQMYRFATRRIAINGLLAFQREQFGPWCLPIGDDE